MRDTAKVDKHVVYGHKPAVGFRPIRCQNSTGLDTGASFGGPLTVGKFDDMEGGGPFGFMHFGEDKKGQPRTWDTFPK